jgi:hypothetical protein
MQICHAIFSNKNTHMNKCSTQQMSNQVAINSLAYSLKNIRSFRRRTPETTSPPEDLQLEIHAEVKFSIDTLLTDSSIAEVKFSNCQK